MFLARVLTVASVFVAAPAVAVTVPVDLSTWTAEGTGNWTRAGDNNSVFQSVNTVAPTVFYAPGNARGLQLSGTIRVTDTGDDDFIGFVLGYQTGDLTASSTDFLLVDWKRGTQTLHGCSGARGLAISRVTAGLGDNAGGWCHSSAFGVQELARGATLGSTGWNRNQTYAFDLLFTTENVRVVVDGVEQFNINGNFSNGAFGFYNYSQPGVTYAGLTQARIPGAAVPEPESWAMLIAGFGLVGGVMRRRRAGLASA
jgi:hypothetical protein